jgi:DNA-binding winged helix-turn-helix (wHTH) protein
MQSAEQRTVTPPPERPSWVFGVFRFDPASLELTRSGRPVPLAPLPAQTLALLIERAGTVVSREALTDHLWGRETYVDAAAGIHTAMRQIRRALGDSASHARFIETLPRRGYRFVAPVERPGVTEAASSALATPPVDARGRWIAIASALAALALVALLALRAPPAAKPPIAEILPSHPAALEAYFKGRYVLDGEGSERAERAVAFFERALDLDERHAPSWLGLAEARLVQANRDGDPAAFAAAAEAADRAVRLAPTLGAAWAARAAARWRADWNWEAAEADYAVALERSPDDADVHLAYAFFCAARGRHDPAIRHGLESRRLEPLEPGANLDLAWLHLYARRWPQVVAESLHALTLEPDLFTAHYTLALGYEGLGEERQATEAYLRMWQAAGAPPARVEAARALAAAERQSQQQEWWTAGHGAARLPAFERALIHFSRGEVAAGWAALERSVDRRELQAAMLAVDPRLDPLRGEATFQELLAAIGRPRPGAPAPSRKPPQPAARAAGARPAP